MIYVVSGNRDLVEEQEDLKYISVEESIEKLNSLSVIGLDTETSGLQVWGDELLTLQLGCGEFQVVIDCTTIDVVLYKELLESNRLFVIHNAKFDLKWLYKYHIVIKNVFDTFLVEKIRYLGYSYKEYSASLKACCERYLNVYLDKSVRGKINYDFHEDVIRYAAKDVEYLESIMELQKKYFIAEGKITTFYIENEFVKVLAYIEFCGIKLDENKWKSKMEKDLKNMQEQKKLLDNWVIDYVINQNHRKGYLQNADISDKKLRKNIKNPIYVISPIKSLFDEYNTEEYKCIINWDSSDQVIPLFKELGLNLGTKDKKTGKIKDSTESKYLRLQQNKSTLIPIYLKYKEYSKVVSSFGQSYLDNINPITKRIHPEFDQLKNTGRVSCGNPDNKGDIKSINIQQLPSTEETRACFVAEEGYCLIDCDYNDQEGRVFTELSQEKKWIEFYNDTAKRDGHSFVAKMLFPEELKDIEEKDVKTLRSDLRQAAKPARFTFNYNGTAETLAVSTGKPLEFCKNCYNKYFEIFSGISDYFKKQKADVWKKGYILISKITGLTYTFPIWPVLKNIESKKNEIPDFWDCYKESESYKQYINEIPINVIEEISKEFCNNTAPKNIFMYYIKDFIPYKITSESLMRSMVYRCAVKFLYKKKSKMETDSCNYPTQGTSAAMSKIAAVKYFNSLIKRDLVHKVYIPNMVHDEILIECPKDIAEQEAKLLKQYMEEAADIFCKSVHIGVSPEIGDHWIH